MTRTLLLTAAIAALAALPAAADTYRYSATTDDVSLSAAATTLTIQLPAATSAGAPSVTLESFTVYCSVDCSVTQAYNGTAASATSASATPIPPNTTRAAKATAWKASNVGAGTAIGGIIHVPAGATVIIQVPSVVVNGAGTAGNYSVTVGAITGTANITGIWAERQ